MASVDVEARDVVAGTVGGLVAYLLGYVFTYVLAASELRDSIGQIIEFFQGDPATYQLVGWVFYNAHFVPTVFTDVPLLNSDSFVGGEGEPSVVLYLVPVALLLATGLALARLQGADDFGEGVLAGLLALPGYFVAALAGTQLFVVEVGSASGAPDLLPAIVLAGVAYPVICAGAGGALAGITGGS